MVWGAYDNIFDRILLNCTFLDGISEFPENVSLSSHISSALFEEQNPIALFTSKCLFDGLIEGNYSSEDLLIYFHSNKGLLLGIDDVESLVELFEEKFPDLLEGIKNFDYRFSKYKKLSIPTVSPLYDFISHTRADIHKSTILLANEMINDHSRRTKSYFKLVGIIEDGLVVECDESGLNTGIDILNRAFERAFKEHLRNVRPLFNVFTGKQLRAKI